MKLVIPFGITISFEVAAQMSREVDNFCLAMRDIHSMRGKDICRELTTDEAAALFRREADRNIAACKLMKLVLTNVVDRM